MAQQGQVLRMSSNGADGRALWAYRYRTGGRGSRRVQRGGFTSEVDAGEALERALERLRRANGTANTPSTGRARYRPARTEFIHPTGWMGTERHENGTVGPAPLCSRAGHPRAGSARDDRKTLSRPRPRNM